MEKIYLKNLSKQELYDLCEKNDNFMNQYYERVYEDNMYWQEEEGKNMLGIEYYKYIDIRDNYSSFYLVLKDWHKFIDNLDSDYLCQEGIELYNYIITKRDTLYNMEQYSDNYDNLEEHLENKCKELLKICEKQLHEYEKYPDFTQVFDNMYDLDWYLENDYYTDENKEKIYVDVAYTKEF